MTRKDANMVGREITKVITLWALQVFFGAAVAYLYWRLFWRQIFPSLDMGYIRFLGIFLIVRMLILRNSEKTFEEDTIYYIVMVTLCLVLYLLIRLAMVIF